MQSVATWQAEEYSRWSESSQYWLALVWLYPMLLGEHQHSNPPNSSGWYLPNHPNFRQF